MLEPSEHFFPPSFTNSGRTSGLEFGVAIVLWGLRFEAPFSLQDTSTEKQEK